MKLPVAWLRRYVDLPEGTTSAMLAERFASLGFPVDAVEAAPRVAGVVVGRIDAVAKHPNADRLSVCTIEAGGDEPLTIATAATNVAAGQTVPVAVVGSRVVGHDERGDAFELLITPRKMRGIESAGMLCSAAELGLLGEWFEDGILQLEPLEPGLDVVTELGLGDDVLDVEVTSNRPDALCVVGFARELAASYGTVLRFPEIDPEPLAAHDPDFDVAIESADCTRFVARVFSDATNALTPGWMRAALALAGQRPLGLLVDISNFVMLELGQPLHFYDAARIAGDRLVVRDARPDERLRTLDDSERVLDARALVVADAEHALGLAGIKGGSSSEITPATTTLVLEAATFSGARIRRTAVALGLRTEASSRHEKSLPVALADVAAARAGLLVRRLAGAEARPPFAAGAAPAAAAPVRLDERELPRLLGMDVGSQEIARALEGLGFSVEPAPGDAPAVDVTPPFWRTDVTIAADLAEEVARVVGYDRIPAVMPPVFSQSIDDSAYVRERLVARSLARLGYREAITYALEPSATRLRYERAGIELGFETGEIRNPLSEDQRYLRFSLLPGLLAIAARHHRTAATRLFELGRLFRANANGTIDEIPAAAWLLVLPGEAEPESWRDGGFAVATEEALALLREITGRDAAVRRAPGLGLHPGKSASLTPAPDDGEPGEPLALVGAVDPRLLAGYELPARTYAGFLWTDRIGARRVPRYRAPSRYPSVERDLALVVDPALDAADLERALREAGGDLVTAARVFDDYRGAQVGGRKSLAVRLTLQRRDATLTDAEVDAVVRDLVAALATRYGAVLRT